MNAKMVARRARAKAAKKAAKEAKKATAASTAESTADTFKVPNGVSNGESSSDSDGPPKKKTKTAEEVSAFKHQKKTADPAKAKSKVTSLQDDPTKSEVYKKLFSSHKTAQNLPKGNWVTFDPRYN